MIGHLDRRHEIGGESIIDGTRVVIICLMEIIAEKGPLFMVVYRTRRSEMMVCVGLESGASLPNEIWIC